MMQADRPSVGPDSVATADGFVRESDPDFARARHQLLQLPPDQKQKT
jgi:hypothetical protein